MFRAAPIVLSCVLCFITGCGESIPVEEQLKTRVTRVTELKDVRLREGKDGVFTGQGMSEKGFYWDIKLKPDANYPKKYSLSWTKGKLTYHGFVLVD